MTPDVDFRFLLLLITLTAALHFSPAVSRSNLFLGLTVDPQFKQSDAARRLLRAFRMGLWGSAVAAAILASTAGSLGWALALWAAGSLLCLAVARRGVSAHVVQTPSVREANLTAPAERMPGGLWAVALPFVALGALAMWAWLHPASLPQQLVLHSTFSGPDRFAVTRMGTVMALIGRAAFCCLILTGLGLGILHGSPRRASSGAAMEAERLFRRRILILMLMAEYFLICLPYIQLLKLPPIVHSVWAGAFMGLLGHRLLQLLSGGQGGERWVLRPQSAALDNRAADSHWKLGLIYFNPHDPAFLVEKHIGQGYTLNFGNPWCWVCLAAILTIPRLLAQL